MYGTCCCCGCMEEITVEEFIEIDQEINDYLCDDCSDKLYELMMDWKLKFN